jgi:ferredoxin
MAYFITEECVSCGSCEGECPESAISAGDDVYVIDEEKCTECGACADTCPTDAIKKN